MELNKQNYIYNKETSNSGKYGNIDLSSMSMEELTRLEDKIRKKEEFNREYDSGILFDKEKESMYDTTGKHNESQKSVFENKFIHESKIKRDRRGKKRGQGGIGEEKIERKNIAGSGQGEYYMDIVRAEMEEQNELNKREFENEKDLQIKAQYQGHLPGAYVRIIIEGIPYEFDKYFDLEYPVVIGGLLTQEMQYGVIECRIKKHRWYKRVLRFNDPLIVSVGWRRYQTMPLYCMEDRGSKRLRMIKYTPDYMHCLCVFYGPIIAPNTGFLGYITCANNIESFRISAIGTVLSCNKSIKMVKKLKLVGFPYEIHKNTVFVKGMFNSNLEVSKFIGGKIQTVSKIRGSIKKAEGKVGNFRATFEDRLLKSDIIFLKAWVPVECVKYFYLCKNLLLNDKLGWEGMKTVGKLRHEMYESKLNEQKFDITGANGVSNARSLTKNLQNIQKSIRPIFKQDSVYDSNKQKVKQHGRNFNKLKVPKKIESNLPFHLRPKYRDPNDDDSTQIEIKASNKKVRNLQIQNFQSKEEREMNSMVSAISNIVANHTEREMETKRRKRKQKRKLEKKRDTEFRQKKRQRIKDHIFNKDNKNSQFEATRGNKFHKEWRMNKK